MIDLERFKIKGRYSSVPGPLWDEFIEALEEYFKTEIDLKELTRRLNEAEIQQIRENLRI